MLCVNCDKTDRRQNRILMPTDKDDAGLLANLCLSLRNLTLIIVLCLHSVMLPMGNPNFTFSNLDENCVHVIHLVFRNNA